MTEYIGYEARKGLIALTKSVISKKWNEYDLADLEAVKLAFMGAGLDKNAADAVAWAIYFASREAAAARDLV